MKIYMKCLDTCTSIVILISIGRRFIEQGMIILNVNKKVKGEERRKGWNMKFVSVFLCRLTHEILELLQET